LNVTYTLVNISNCNVVFTVESYSGLCTRESCPFPNLRRLAQKMLLLPIGTATVERFFSTLNRILNYERCRLLPNHVDMLMKISIDGPEVPDVRSSTPDMEKRCRSWRIQRMQSGARRQGV